MVRFMHPKQTVGGANKQLRQRKMRGITAYVQQLALKKKKTQEGSVVVVARLCRWRMCGVRHVLLLRRQTS